MFNYSIILLSKKRSHFAPQFEKKKLFLSVFDDQGIASFCHKILNIEGVSLGTA